MALCNALEPNGIIGIAVTHCAGFEMPHLSVLLQCFAMHSVPFNSLYSAAQFIRLETILPSRFTATPSIDDVFAFDCALPTPAIIFSACKALSFSAPNEKLQVLHPDQAVILAYKWAAMGVPEHRIAVLEHWHKIARASTPLKFGSLFKLVLRQIEKGQDKSLLAAVAFDAMTQATAYYPNARELKGCSMKRKPLSM